MPVVLAAAAMGCRFELVLDGPDEVRLRAAGEEALEEVHRLDRALSLFARDSAVADLNRRAATEAVRVDGELFALLERCGALHASTAGAFDPGLGRLMELQGFRGGARGTPDPSRVAEVLREGGFARVALDPTGRRVRFLGPLVALDLGAVAKGWALDRAGECLREAGVRRALLHAGTSSVLAVGRPARRAGWGVALRHPDGGAAVAVVDLVDEALGVSAPHGRRRAPGTGPEDPAEGHVLDPRTGHPAPGARLAAVLHEEAATADALATAALVGGPVVDARGGTPPVLRMDAAGRVVVGGTGGHRFERRRLPTR